jgi:FkbM family methyltransferase
MTIKATKILRSLAKPIRKLTNRPYREACAALKAMRKDGIVRRRYEHPLLNSGSVVFDLGGFQGEWTDGIFVRYHPTIHVFEPHPKFAQLLQEKYARNTKIQVHECALASADGTFELHDLGDGSSAHRTNGQTFLCKAVEARAFLGYLGVRRIDLMKLNIEGGEYEILPHLSAIGMVPNIRVFQVQFHLLSKESIPARNRIRAMFAKTHQIDWCYDFVWEQWSLLGDPLATTPVNME